MKFTAINQTSNNALDSFPNISEERFQLLLSHVVGSMTKVTDAKGFGILFERSAEIAETNDELFFVGFLCNQMITIQNVDPIDAFLKKLCANFPG